MKIDIRSHYWPNTPHLREIKIFFDGVLIQSFFLNQDEIWDLAKQFRELHDRMIELGNSIEDN